MCSVTKLSHFVDLALHSGRKVGARPKAPASITSQVLSLESTSKVGNPVRIAMITDIGDKVPTPERDLLLDMVWSADSRYVVFVGLTSFAVVDVDAIAEAN